MAHRLTVVVPTKDSVRTIGACLLSARRQGGADVEIVVVDNRSGDATIGAAEALADRVISAGSERSAQRNEGAAVATGEILLFVDSDQTLDPGVAAAVIEAFTTDADIGAVVVPELARGDGFWARCRALEKRLYVGDAAAEAARAYRRTRFEDLGGFHEELAGGEDYDLEDRVLAAGYRVGRVARHLWHDEGRVRLRGTFRKKRYYGRFLPAYVRSGPRGWCRFARRSLLGRWRLLVADPAHAIGLVVLKLVDAAGLCVGALEGRVASRARQAD